MATSGTYNFSPNIGDLIRSAFARLQIRSTELLQEHLEDGQREANLWLSSVANRGPNLWTVDLQTVALSPGVPTYDVPPETVMILDVYVEIDAGAGTTNSRVISPLSRSDFAGLPDRLKQGQPTSFWFDRQINPTISMWPCPDAGGPYVLKFYRYRQVQDANLSGGQNIELPYLFLDAFVAGLAHRLARIWKPALEAQRKADADEAWAIASTQNVENAPLSIIPSVIGYFR